jgi:hypothetical protein
MSPSLAGVALVCSIGASRIRRLGHKRDHVARWYMTSGCPLGGIARQRREPIGIGKGCGSSIKWRKRLPATVELPAPVSCRLVPLRARCSVRCVTGDV